MDVEKSNKGPNLFRYKGQPWSSLTNFFNEVSGKCNVFYSNDIIESASLCWCFC